jgi:hypothetical protein
MWRKNVVASVCLAACSLISQAGAQEDQDFKPGDFCKNVKPGLARTDAVDCPSKHAWDLFLALNHPAVDPTKGRGVPDTSKKFGAPGTTTVWETMRQATTDVYKDDGTRPPDNYDEPTPGAATGKIPELPKHIAIARAKAKAEGKLTAKFGDDGVFRNSGGFGETHMNRAMYEFTLKEGLYNLNGQQQYARDVIAKKRPTISFPPDAIEVKAAWLDFADPQGDGSVPAIPIDKQATYYTYTDQKTGKKYGLTALHILTKDIPNWFWATFHHKDEPDGAETEDTWGPPDVIKGTIWENYKLGGTQTDFVDQSGKPTKLSDYFVEFKFTDSSCMSCHARATASPIPGPKSTGLQSSVKLGSPNPAQFRDNDGNLIYVPLDFVFSMPFRAKWLEEKK